MDNNGNTLVLKDYPIGIWITGLILGGVGFFMLIAVREVPWFIPVIMGFVGLLLLILTAILTITVDRTAGLLTLDYRSILRHTQKQIPLRDLSTIRVQTRVSHDEDGTSTTYNIAAILRDGNVVPFRTYTSSGYWGKEKKAKQLREFIGLGGGPGDMLEGAMQFAQSQFVAQQEEITGDQDQERITNGVRWKVETRAFGGSPVTRWHSPDFNLPNSFVYLAQKLQGQGANAGFLAPISGMLFKASMKIYGFNDNDAPNLSAAKELENPDPRLNASFSVFTPDPTTARQILNPWTSIPLAQWAEKYPLTQGTQNQLIVMFCPAGTYLVVLGLVNPDYLDELANLGAEIVRAQGGGTR